MLTKEGSSVPQHTDLASLIVVYWITLVSEAARGLILPSAWPLVKSFGGGKTDLGFFVASFSVGRMATTIPLGILSDNCSMATVLALASLVQVVGHGWYAMSSSLHMLILSRIFAGFGSATMSVCRAHLTRTVLPERRTCHFAYLSALQFTGFALLPGVGGLLAELPRFKFLGLDFNGFTYPAYVLIVSNLLSIVALFYWFTNPPEQAAMPAPTPPIFVISTSSVSSSASSPFHDPSDALLSKVGDGSLSDEDMLHQATPDSNTAAIYTCIFVNFTFRGLMAQLETITIPVLMERFDLSFANSSYCISLIGVLGLGVYFNFKLISQKNTDRDLILAGLFLVLAGAVPLSIPQISETLPLPIYMTILSIVWSLAYPIGQTSALSLFTKTLGALPVGSFLGFFSMSGSVARIIFAMMAGYVFSHLGREAVFASIGGLMIVSLVLVSVNYSKLVAPG